jgi:hypothetical protein
MIAAILPTFSGILPTIVNHVGAVAGVNASEKDYKKYQTSIKNEI